ncbi:unnamed protein product [Sphacelaria rigidula]
MFWLFSNNYKDIDTSYIVFDGVAGVVATGIPRLIRTPLMATGNVFSGNNQL